ncbi:hypothetical protein CC2G_013874 [Coprinopsis cinerea AmutBmut pab1-1]|nr:hypothetical protein CC2G_013874 [Coprinopsis cinerea AmutBmut pab1-1]
MFKAAVQPPIISLFSSTGSDPLGFWSQKVESARSGLAVVHLLHDTTSEPLPVPPASLIAPPLSENHGYLLDQTVLHVQGPDLRKTYIQCPPDSGADQGFSSALGRGDHDQRGSMSTSTAATAKSLGIRHHYVHLQLRPLGKDWSFEVGVMDQGGNLGILRFSTFQTSPKLKLRTTKPPLLHLPLSFPSPSPQMLTPWTTIDLHLPTFLAYFTSPELGQKDTNAYDPERNMHSRPTRESYPVPKAGYSHICYIRVYASCRIRRIWLDNESHNQNLPWEFQLYSGQ